MKRKLFISCYLILAYFMFMDVNIGYAAVTGKISGRIIDSQTEEPLPGANVQLVGTFLGAAADLDGFYSILNVPPGIYELQVTMMGYQETVIQQVRVKIDLTTKIDVSLNETVLEIGDVVIVVADRPLVQQDLTSSIASVGSEEINVLPVQSVADILEMQAGVVREGSSFHIRGGRDNEVTFLVDGVEVTDAYAGRSMGATVEKDAIQEMQLVSGTFNAEYGKAMSGVVSIITKEGSNKYSGKLNVYAGDYVSSDKVYSVLERVEPGPTDPQTGEVTEIEHLKNPLNDLNLTFNTDFTLSGPIPLLSDKLTFFANGRYISSDGYLYGSRWFTPQGLPGDSSLVPMTARIAYSTLAKLTYKITPSIKLNYQFLWDKSHSPIRGYVRAYKYVPDGLRQNLSHSYTHMLMLSHSLSKNTFYELRLARMDNNFKTYLYEDPTKTPGYLIDVPGDSTGAGAMLFNPYTEAGKILLDSLQQNDISHSWVIDPANPDGYVDPELRSTSTSFSFQNAGTENNLEYRDYGFTNAKFDLTSQLTPVHQIKLGFDGKIHDLKRDSYTLVDKRNDVDVTDLFVYTPSVPDVESLNREKYSYNPVEMSAYLQDKIELLEMIINIGVRFDYFDPDATVPSDVRDPDIYRPLKEEHIYKNWDAAYAATLSQVDLEDYKASLEAYTPEERKAFMRKDVPAKFNISPRIGISFPITSKGIIHFSYGHFLGMPGFQYLYNDASYKLPTSGNKLFGNPDLEPEKTVHYEIGLQQQLGNDIGLDVTLFYKDTRDWVGTSPLYKTVQTRVSYSKYVNKDYSNVYGMTLDLEKRFSHLFAARVYYAYQLAEGTYSNPKDAFDQVYNASEPEEPRLAMVPMNWDQRHTLNAYLTMNTGNWTFTVTGRYLSGDPYTPSISKSETTGGATYVGWSTNSERIPSSSSVDLRVFKSFPIDEWRINLYAIIYNVFDQRGVTGVFSASGLADFDPNTYADYHGYNASRIGSYNEQIRRPDYYQSPRQVQLGLSLSF
jgi:outer membrane receptor protein involved in Fe transport